MAWKDARGSTRVAVTGVRQVAHADDSGSRAKSRHDESTRAAQRSLSPRVLVGAGAVLVVLALVAFLAFRGGDSGVAAGTPSTTPAPTASASPTGPSPVEVLTASAPAGTWKLVMVGRSTTTRGGKTTPFHARGQATTWTFPAAQCSDQSCEGVITSSSGRTFPFTWDGNRLVVTHDDTVRHDKKRACIDNDTGQVLPIDESAATATYHDRFSPFKGSADRLVSTDRIRTTYEFFGTCHPGPDDTVLTVYDWVLTPVSTT